MLCPEVWNFPPPKTISTCKNYENLEPVLDTIRMNSFYKSVVITCPDELQTPSCIEEVVTEDSEYYRISDCSVIEFIEPNFIENFVRNGKLYCLTADRNCIVQNCAAVTPEGILTLHILEFIFQTLGLEGTKRPHSFYEVKIDLKNLKHYEKVKQCVQKLEKFDFYIIWEPDNDDICPSSIAKYFNDRNIKVILQKLSIKKLTPSVEEIPSPKDVDADEMVEWIGMLAHGADLNQTETYISTYSQPESEFALKSTRISLLIFKGFFTPTMISDICKKLSNYVLSRDLDNYWTSLSVQSQENCLWQWNKSGPRMFQAHNSSCNIFLARNNFITYSVGQLKYS